MEWGGGACSAEHGASNNNPDKNQWSTARSTTAVGQIICFNWTREKHLYCSSPTKETYVGPVNCLYFTLLISAMLMRQTISDFKFLVIVDYQYWHKNVCTSTLLTWEQLLYIPWQKQWKKSISMNSINLLFLCLKCIVMLIYSGGYICRINMYLCIVMNQRQTCLWPRGVKVSTLTEGCKINKYIYKTKGHTVAVTLQTCMLALQLTLCVNTYRFCFAPQRR